MAIELVPLCTLHVQLKPPIEVGAGCAGTRVIVEVASAEVKGDRLRAELAEPQSRTGSSSVLTVRRHLTSGRRFVPMTARSSSCSTTAKLRRIARRDCSSQRRSTSRLASRQAMSATRGSTAFRRLARGPSTRIFRSTTSGTRFAKVAGASDP